MIHKTADVQSANIGEGTKVWQFSIVLPEAVIGADCNINAHCLIENKVKIGDRVTVKCGNYIWDGITIENDVFVGPNVTFTNDALPRSGNADFQLEETVLKEGCSIGGDAVILPGVEIGKYALVGAGSLITKSIPDFQMWFGSPAIHKGYITKEGKLLSLELICKETEEQYKLNELNEPVK